MSRRIAVVGSNMVDLISYVTRMPDRGETVEAPDFRMGCGGKGANQAVAAAKLGADVMMVTKVGDDVFADNTIANFRRFGVDTTWVEKVPGTSSGVAPIFVEPSGENSILIIKGANAHLLPADIDRAAADLKRCDLILMQLEVPIETVYHTIDFAKANGIETILNPAPAAPLDPEKVSKVTFFTPNQTELALITGLPVGDEAEAVTAAKSLVARGLRTVVVTLGARGALVVTAESVTRVPPVAVTPKDTTGAGDAFIGSFARFYVESRDVLGSLGKAALYAADSITKPGTQTSYATAEEFAALMAANSPA
ncbi:MAG: ribokinase [Phyllobacteriaceae bacterium]|nr:ribokinase [Phyllobacteriaceae bacterium]